MKIVIPVFPASDAERERAKRPLKGLPTAAHLALRATALPGATVIVVAQTHDLRDMLALAGLDVHLAPQRQCSAPALHIQGGQEALHHLLAQGLLERHSTVVLADWRTPTLPLDALRKASAQAKASPETFCASLREVRDSPIQCHVPQRVLFLDQQVFREPHQVGRQLLGLDDKDREIAVSRPFYFNWLAHDVTSEDHKLYAAAAGARSPIIRLTPVSLARRKSWPSPWIYYREQPLLARRLIETSKQHARHETASPVQAVTLPSPVLVQRDARDGAVTCRVDNSVFHDDFLLRIWPLRGLNKGAALESAPFRAKNRQEAHSTFRFNGAEEADSLIICALAAHCGSEYDFTEPVSGGEELWTIDPLTKARIDPSTGIALSNRQQFPVVLEIDGAIVAGRIDTILAIETLSAITPLACELKDEENPQGDLESLVALPTPGRPAREKSRADGPETSLEALVAGLHELGSTLSALRSMDNAQTPGFSDLKQRAETLFAAQEARVEEYFWRYDRLKAYVLQHVTRHQCDRSLDEIVDSQTNRLVAMRLILRTAAQDFANTLEAADVVGFGTVAPSAGRPGAPSKTFLCPIPSGDVPPFIPRALASDGASRLYLSAFEDRGWRGGIYVKNVSSGELTSWGEEKRTYGTLWYDKDSRLLYAMPRTKEEQWVSGIDVYDEEGKCLERVVFQNKGGNPLYAAYCLKGNADNLFFGDAKSWSIKVLNKSTLTLEDSIQIKISDYFTSFAVHEQVLHVSTRHQHLLVRHALADASTTVCSGLHVIFPGHMALDGDRGIFYVVSSEHLPRAQERQSQWVKRYDETLNFIDSCRLGWQNVLDLHVLEGARMLAVADNEDGLQLFRLP